MRRAFYSGISGKIALIFLLAFLLVILPLNTFIYHKLKVTLEEADNRLLHSEAEKLLSQVSLDPPIIPLPPSGYSIKVQTTDGQFFQPVFQSPAFPEIGDEYFIIEVLNLDTLKIFTLRKPLEFGGGEILLSLSGSNVGLQNQLADFRMYFFYITGLVVLVVIIVVFAVSGIMLRPIKKIIESSGKIASASEFEPLPIPRPNDESRELAIALNGMLQRIQSAHDDQQKFFDSATHELKTPLSIMKAELTSSIESKSREDLNKVLGNILEEVNRLERTISDFLLMSQLKSNMITLRKEKLNLAELVYDGVRDLKGFSVSREIGFSVHLSNHTNFIIEADTDKIRTVLSNLLENAIHYSPEKETVQIEIKEQEQNVSLTIENKSQAPIQNVSMLGKERYTHSTSARGMGLGLWICGRIIELHEGKLSMEVKGNTFRVRVFFNKVE